MLNGYKQDELIKKKILHMKENTIGPKSNNNSVSINISNNIYQNYINNLYVKNKDIFINKIHRKNNQNQNIIKF